MSTTDSNAAFEAYMREQGHTDDDLKRPYGNYFWKGVSERWEGWQAALEWQTEAAKATGTAGDLPELPQCFGSIDVYHDSGQVTSVDGWTADQMRGYAIDYAMQLGLAARQPAPVVVKPWETRMQEYFAQGSVKMRTPASFMADEIIDSRAALAATAAPVLSDDQIEELARKHNLDGSMLHGSRMDDYVLPFARDVIAATNRSQP